MNPSLYSFYRSRAYCSTVRSRKTPPRPLAIAWSRAWRLARSGRPPPRSISPIGTRSFGYPKARLLRLSKYGLEPVRLEETDHFKVLREFYDDPAGFVEGAIAE